MPGPAREPEASNAWSWTRLARIGLLLLFGLAALDAGLAGVERRTQADAARGAVRNTWGLGITDAARAMMLETPDAIRARAIFFLGSSVTYGAGLDADETVPAQTARLLAERGLDVPVFNAAQSGGLPRAPVPFAAAAATHPVQLMLVEVLVPAYAKRSKSPTPPLSNDQRALMLAASEPGRALIDHAGYGSAIAQRVESRVAGFVSAHWRAYRIRGRLWIDDNFMPNLLVWSLRRWAAGLGMLPKRFQGQTTNVGKLPWREAYSDGVQPNPGQRLRVPVERIDEDYYRDLVLTQRLAEIAGVPTLFYEVPVNEAFQREFGLMDEASLARMSAIAEMLVARMRADGLEVVRAPTDFPDDGFLDKAHVTPDGAARFARHLLPVIESRLEPGSREDG